MPKPKIARRRYQRARQSELAVLAMDVLQRLDRGAAYRTLQPALPLLDERSKDYRACLVAAQNGGRAERVAKNQAKIALIRQLDVLADALETLAQGDRRLLADAGFSLQQAPVLRYAQKLPSPTILRAYSTGKRGEVRLIVDNGIAPGTVLTHAFEYAADRAGGWQGLQYNSYCKFIARGLPHARELWLRMRSLGHGDNVSDWSEPVSVAVL